MEELPRFFDLQGSKPRLRVGKQFNSKEKQLVRNQLWLPIYKQVCTSTSPIGRIKYLCFPGLGCSFVKQLIALGYISKTHTTIVALEPNKSWHKIIYEYFARTFEKAKYEVLEGNYEDLIEQERLIKWFFEPPFGFDIMELDFPVSLFSLGSDKRSMILEAIAKTLKVQAFFCRSFNMIAAFKATNKISAELGSVYGDATKMLVKEILERENSLLNNRILTGLIKSGSTASLYDEKCSLYAIPLAIIRRSEGICNVRLKEIPYTHVSKSVGANSRIISYVFRCEPRNYTIDCGGNTLFDETRKSMVDAIEKTYRTFWV